MSVDGTYALKRVADGAEETVFTYRYNAGCDQVGFVREEYDGRLYAALGGMRILLKDGIYVWQFTPTSSATLTGETILYIVLIPLAPIAIPFVVVLILCSGVKC
jgi:hypothetical protein